MQACPIGVSYTSMQADEQGGRIAGRQGVPCAERRKSG